MTVPLGKDNNVATFRTAPGYDKFEMFCKECKLETDEELSRPQLINEPAVQDVGDDDGKVKWLGGSSNQLWSKDKGLPISKRQAAKEQRIEMNKSNPIMMDLKGVDSSSNAAEYPSKETLKSTELLMYHTRFGRISFLKLRKMAKQNIIPK